MFCNNFLSWKVIIWKFFLKFTIPYLGLAQFYCLCKGVIKHILRTFPSYRSESSHYTIYKNSLKCRAQLHSYFQFLSVFLGQVALLQPLANNFLLYVGNLIVGILLPLWVYSEASYSCCRRRALCSKFVKLVVKDSWIRNESLELCFSYLPHVRKVRKSLCYRSSLWFQIFEWKV